MNDWRDHAACKGVPAAVFYIERGESSAPAKEICAGCPVRGECLEWALENNEVHGIWGGMNPRERRKIKRGTFKPCGTHAAAQRHRYHGEPVCGPCREADAAYTRARAQRRGAA